ncbi:MAG: hypothetical protein DHS20C01_12860 [marine bacterium B5-7]|nr:MAG: hypothetical protein DHS20C01_12860 [marine bacterium B5-7]
MYRYLFLLLLLLVNGLARAGDLQQLLQLIDYVGVDYSEAVADGRVINQDEYQEMLDFSAGIQQLVAGLPEDDTRVLLREQASMLSKRIAGKALAEEISVLTARMRLAVINGYQVTAIPDQPPDLARGALLYNRQCVSCHGVTGDGAGPAADGMDPPPVSFQDHMRFSQRTLYGLYNTITQGVTDTAMPSYHELSDKDRWALAFHVGRLAADQTVRAADAEKLLGDSALMPLLDVHKFTVTTPAEVVHDFGEGGGQLMAWLRNHPEDLFSRQSPLMFSRHRLDDVLAAYRDADKELAYQLAVEAYLEGFELVEQGLNAVDPDLRVKIEQAMTGLRTLIRQGAPLLELEAEVAEIKRQLDQAMERLDERSLSSGAAFTAAFLILLREGLEALLVVVALAAFLVKTEHRDSLRYLHYGWIGALVAGFFTWWASMSLIEISGASREVTEGLAALLATAVLFYVGFWLHNKSSVAQWKQFIETNVKQALSTGTIWGIAGLSFIAVYREVFETILFYQTLWVQVDQVGKYMALAGLGAGAVALAVLALLVIRYSARLPLRQFFSVTGLLMFVLALIFAGKGVAALQEAGYIPVIPLSIPRVELLGIYPNLPGLLLQLGLLLLALYLWFWLPGKRRATET